MQRTGYITIDGKDYKVLTRTETKTSEWIILAGEMPDDEPRFPQNYEIGLEEM